MDSSGDNVWDYVSRLAQALLYWQDPQPDSDLGRVIAVDPDFASDIIPRFPALYGDLFGRLQGPFSIQATHSFKGSLSAELALRAWLTLFDVDSLPNWSGFSRQHPWVYGRITVLAGFITSEEQRKIDRGDWDFLLDFITDTKDDFSNYDDSVSPIFFDDFVEFARANLGLSAGPADPWSAPRATQPTSATPANVDEPPPPPYAATCYIGLGNQGATCYLNSLLQSLFMTPEFRNRLLYHWNWHQQQRQQQQLEGQDEDLAEDSIALQLQFLFARLLLFSSAGAGDSEVSPRPVQTQALTAAFGWVDQDRFRQQDIQELCRVLFDALEQTVPAPLYKALVTELYQGNVLSYVRCRECDRESRSPQTFLDLALVVKDCQTLGDALDQYLSPELMEGDNAYMCDGCKRRCPAERGTKLQKLPYILTLVLKRFDLDHRMMHIKLNHTLVFPWFLDCSEFLGGKVLQRLKDREVPRPTPAPAATSSTVPADSSSQAWADFDPFSALGDFSKSEKVGTSSSAVSAHDPFSAQASAPMEICDTGDASDHEPGLRRRNHLSAAAMSSAATLAARYGSGVSSRGSASALDEFLPDLSIAAAGDASDVDSDLEYDQRRRAVLRRPPPKVTGTLDWGSGGLEQSASSVALLRRPEFQHPAHLPVHSEDEREAWQLLDQMQADAASDDDADPPPLYELYSVLVHRGGANSGHYYAFIKELGGPQWYRFDDARVEPVSRDCVAQESFGRDSEARSDSGGNAYMVLYRRCDRARNLSAHQIPVDKHDEPLQLPAPVEQLVVEERAARNREWLAAEERMRIESDPDYSKIMLFANLTEKEPDRRDEEKRMYEQAAAADVHLVNLEAESNNWRPKGHHHWISRPIYVHKTWTCAQIIHKALEAFGDTHAPAPGLAAAPAAAHDRDWMHRVARVARLRKWDKTANWAGSVITGSTNTTVASPQSSASVDQALHNLDCTRADLFMSYTSELFLEFNPSPAMDPDWKAFGSNSAQILCWALDQTPELLEQSTEVDYDAVTWPQRLCVQLDWPIDRLRELIEARFGWLEGSARIFIEAGHPKALMEIRAGGEMLIGYSRFSTTTLRSTRICQNSEIFVERARMDDLGRVRESFCAQIIERRQNMVKIHYNHPNEVKPVSHPKDVPRPHVFMFDKNRSVVELRLALAEHLKLNPDTLLMQKLYLEGSSPSEFTYPEHSLDYVGYNRGGWVHLQYGLPLQKGEKPVKFVRHFPEEDSHKQLQEWLDMGVDPEHTISQVAERLAAAAKLLFGMDVPATHLRMRQLYLGRPTSVYRPAETVREAIGFSMYDVKICVEILTDEELEISNLELGRNDLLFPAIQVWQPAQFQLGKRIELSVSKEMTSLEFAALVFERTGIQVEHQLWVRPIGEFDPLDWERLNWRNFMETWSLDKTLTQSPYFFTDGDTVYIRDSQEGTEFDPALAMSSPVADARGALDNFDDDLLKAIQASLQDAPSESGASVGNSGGVKIVVKRSPANRGEM